jgi:hypothetical protein
VYHINVQSFGGSQIREVPMTLETYVDKLKKKHAKLSQDVDNEQKKQFPDMMLLSILKKEKLIIKEKLVQKARLL